MTHFIRNLVPYESLVNKLKYFDKLPPDAPAIERIRIWNLTGKVDRHGQWLIDKCDLCGGSSKVIEELVTTDDPPNRAFACRNCAESISIYKAAILIDMWSDSDDEIEFDIDLENN